MKISDREGKWVSAAAMIFCIGAGFIFIRLILRYAAPTVLSVFAAFAAAFSANKAAEWISSKTGISKRLLALLILFASLTLIGATVILACIKLSKEAEELILWISVNREAIFLYAKRLLLAAESALSGLLPMGSDTAEYTGKILSTAVNELLSSVTSALSRLLASALGNAPKAFLLLVALLLSGFYLTADYDKIRDWLTRLLPSALHPTYHRLRAGLVRAISHYLRAYCVIFIMTLCEVYVGLLFLKAPYALLAALAVAAVDILPIFGAGAILLPWGICAIVFGNRFLGIGLIILYGVITVVRQISEPRIMGEGLGIHPLASLLFMLAFFFLFGPIGIPLSPLAAFLCKELLNRRAFQEKSKKM